SLAELPERSPGSLERQRQQMPLVRIGTALVLDEECDGMAAQPVRALPDDARHHGATIDRRGEADERRAVGNVARPIPALVRSLHPADHPRRASAAESDPQEFAMEWQLAEA